MWLRKAAAKDSGSAPLPAGTSRAARPCDFLPASSTTTHRVLPIDHAMLRSMGLCTGSSETSTTTLTTTYKCTAISYSPPTECDLHHWIDQPPFDVCHLQSFPSPCAPTLPPRWPSASSPCSWSHAPPRSKRTPSTTSTRSSNSASKPAQSGPSPRRATAACPSRSR